MPRPPAPVLVPLLALAALLPTPSPLPAQEVGIFAGRGRSGFDAMRDPWSLALHAQLPVPGLPFLRAAGGVRRGWSERRRASTTCDRYWPDFTGCTQEPVVSRARLDQWEVGLALGVQVAPGVELRAAGLRVHNDVEASARGVETGRSAGNVYPDEPVWSTAVAAGVAWRRLADGHLGLVARVRREVLDFRTCPTDVGTPFCAAERLVTFELGVVVAR